MPILQRDDAPRDGARAISSALEDLSFTPATDPMLGGAAIDLSQPIAVYVLGLKDISADPAILAQAKLTTWRYLLGGNGLDGTAYADVAQFADRSKMSSVSKNPNAEALLAAAATANEIAEGMPEEVELRVLEVPALKLSAVWLSGATNVFIPYIDGEPDSAIKQTVLEIAEFLNEIGRRAANVR